ncbi:MAG: ABC transporter ATP-binding protein [Clostridium sp.]|jgi:ABC-type multidrug transport system ATPase subunit|nr:ABC transporter ATP-binding protein [Clostridium sp.]
MSIQIENVSMQFKGTRALDDVSLQIGEGIFGLLGENGAGKTTLMRILCTLLKPTEGAVSVYGRQIRKENIEEIKRWVGYLPQELGLYPSLTVRESLDYIGGLCGMSKGRRRERIDLLLEMTNLTEHQKKKNRQLSGGMKRRVGLVQAMLHSPRLLIVDEPTAGLDPEERIRIRNLLVDFAQGRTVLFSTHVVEDLSATSHELCMLNKGKVRYIGTIDEMLRKAEGHVYQCALKKEQEILEMRKNYFVTGNVYSGTEIQVRFLSEEEPEIPCARAAATLEDAYIYLNH